jgi:phosphotransferase system enzyme I (PtsI)
LSNQSEEKRLPGISGVPGICIGKVYLVDSEGVDVIKKYHINEDLIKDETARFKTAVYNAKNELKEVIKNTPAALGEHVQILETHLLLFKDKMLYQKTIDTIEDNLLNAEWALKTVVDETKKIFKNIEDEYLKSRGADIVHVADRIMMNLTGAVEVNIADIRKRVILVAKDLSPAQTSQIQLDKIMGFVTDKGGTASHTSIIAKTLELPCVLGLEKATNEIKNDDIIIVDGLEGLVIINPDEDTLLEFEKKKKDYELRQAEVTRSSHLPARTLDGVTINVMGNIEFAEEVVSVKDHGGDGVGLYRTEFLYMNRDSYPDEEEQFEKYREVTELMSPGSVIIRTLDINGDKALKYNYDQAQEQNPALGLRAIRFCLKRKEIFKSQLRAILRASEYGKIKILFPMISSLGELKEANRVLEQCKEELTNQGINWDKDIKTGIMIEIPSAAIIADILADETDFFSLGTNDLVQYTLAIDRGNEEVAHLYNELNPAVLRLIENTVRVAKEKNIELSICGEMAGNSLHLPLLLGLGITNLSMYPHAIPGIKQMIREMNLSDTIELTKEIFRQNNCQDSKELIRYKFGEILKL